MKTKFGKAACIHALREKNTPILEVKKPFAARHLFKGSGLFYYASRLSLEGRHGELRVGWPVGHKTCVAVSGAHDLLRKLALFKACRKAALRSAEDCLSGSMSVLNPSQGFTKACRRAMKKRLTELFVLPFSRKCDSLQQTWRSTALQDRFDKRACRHVCQANKQELFFCFLTNV